MCYTEKMRLSQVRAVWVLWLSFPLHFLNLDRQHFTSPPHCPDFLKVAILLFLHKNTSADVPPCRSLMTWCGEIRNCILIEMLNIKSCYPSEKKHFVMKFDIFYYFLVCTTRYITDTKQTKTLRGKIIKGTIQTYVYCTSEGFYTGRL